MSAYVSRRHLLGITAASLIFPYAGKLHAGPAAIAAALVAKELAGAAVKYFGERQLAAMFGGNAGPTNKQILDAIYDSTEELKEFVRTDIRQALTERKIDDLSSLAAATHQKIAAYTRLSSEERRKYLHLLTDSDNDAREGLAAADNMGTAGIIPYSMFASLRIPVEVCLFARSNSSTAYKAFAGELQEMASVLFDKVGSYMLGRSPTARMGGLECFNRESGGQFPINEGWCEYKLDGKPSLAAKGFIASGNGMEAIRRRSEESYEAQYQLASKEHYRELTEFANPLYECGRIWVRVANEIDSDLNGEVRSFSR